MSLSLFAGENRWTIKGPDAGSPATIVFDPIDSSIAYAATSNGVFRSSDGGQHWTVGAGTLGTPFGDVAVANGAPQNVFASSVYGLYKSSNRGVTWSRVHPFGSFKVAVSATGSVVYSVSTGGPIRSSDGGVTFGSAGSGFPAATSVMALVVDPLNADTVYAALLSSAGVYKSTDGAAHWSAANTGLTASAYSLVVDPSNSSTLYAGGGPGRIFKTTDAASSWTELTNGLGNGFYRSMSITSSPSTIIAVTDAGFYKSTNAGSSWTGPSQPGADTAVAVDPNNASNILLASNFNLVRSTNGGSNFTPSASGLTAAYTQSIAVDPRNESIVYTSGAAGIFKSIDHGESWTSLLTGLNQFIAVDPFNSQTLYATTSGTVRRSLNGGTSWEDFNTGLPTTSGGIVADPLTPGTFYAVQGAPYRKAGTSAWTIKNSGLPTGTFATFVAIDPNNASVLYTGGSFGIYKSTNAGDSWTSAGSGLSASGAAGISIDRFDSNHLLAWVNSSGFESTNGGASWAPFATTPGRQAIVLAFDPSAPGRIYNSSSDAVERSNDGGRTWFSISTGLGTTHGNLFVISQSGNSLFTGGSDGGVWVFHFGRSRAVGH
ncbi:MAG TPA: hypothetical protein VGQ65_09540 [Thermoanaerobaculia bacterium]|jgi:photosystem II stability/assembly factor-like uncharacterized protein|nr:hypothetical protein [Thermoanaerobaculia bacterium]